MESNSHLDNSTAAARLYRVVYVSRGFTVQPYYSKVQSVYYYKTKTGNY